MNEKQIIFVINCLGGIGSGGSDRVVTVLANQFVKSAAKVKIIALTDDTTIDRVLDKNIECVFIEKIPNLRMYKVIKSIQIFKTLYKNIKSTPNCTVISFISWVNIFVILRTLFSKCKVIVSERTDPRVSMKYAITRKIRDLLYRTVDCIVFQTEEAKALFPINIQRKSVVIPNPIKENLPIKKCVQRRKEIVNFCRLVPQKNLFMLIDAFDLLHSSFSDYHLTIYGRGELLGELLAYVERKNLKEFVHLKDFDPDIHSKIIDAAMFVSSSNYEGISNSMLEAMAIGLPVICTDCPVGGARMFINSYENGILVPVNDTFAMFRAMQEIITNNELAIKMSENAILVRNKLSINSIYKQWSMIV